MKNLCWFLGTMMVVGGGCGAAADSTLGTKEGGSGRSAQGGAGGSSGGNVGPSAGERPTLSMDAAPPPEKESNLDFLAPQAGGRYVYVANPGRNTVTVIDSETLAIREVAAGSAPTFLATVPGKDIALVINAGSHTLSIVRGANPPGAAILRIVSKANAIAVAPDGRHAVVWFDASLANTTTQNPALTGSTQDVSVVDLSGTSDVAPVSMTVGYKPSAVVFSSDGAAAFMVTEDGISQLRFAEIKGPSIAPLTRIDNKSVVLVRADAGAPDATSIEDAGAPAGDGGGQVGEAGAPEAGIPQAPSETPTGESPTPPAPSGGRPVDVSVTPDGHYAIARREGGSELLLVDLKVNKVTAIRLSSEVTDLDMLPSGAQAFAVLRSESKLVRLDIPAGFGDAGHQAVWQFAGEFIGSATMSSSGRYALLYTTAVSSNSLVKFDLTTLETTTIPLRKAIRAVAIAPSESSALVLHTKVSGNPAAAGLSEQEFLDRSYGYTLVDLPTTRTNQVLTPANPNPFVITPDSSYAFVLLRDDSASVRIAQSIALDSFLTQDFALSSPPHSISALSATTHKVFVGQVHPQGRISFIDWKDGSMQSVTGFVLSGGIQQ